MCLLKADEPDYKPADWYLNWRPIYKPVRFTISSQHIYYITVFFEEILVSHLFFCRLFDVVPAGPLSILFSLLAAILSQLATL